MPRRDLFFIELMDWVQHRHNPYYRHSRLYVTLFSWKRPSFRYYLGGAVELLFWPDKNAIQAAKERKREQCRLEELKEHKRKRQPKRRKDYK